MRRPPLLSGLLACAAATSLAAAEPSPLTVPLAAEKPRYLDADAPLEERVTDLVGRLTLQEKAIALDHNGPDLERIGLRADKWNQCLNGVQWDRSTTLFPTCIALGATWDPPLIKEVAGALSDEARAISNGWRSDPAAAGQRKGLIYRAPVINISRNPYWGRIHEVYSEDPFLTGRCAVAYVQGLQGDDPHYLKIAATLKHYAVNNVEQGRTGLNATVSERTLREYWLPHFRDAVVEGHAQSLMASYNAINGTPNNMNHWLLTEVLKQEWGHQGFVVSDLGGVRTMVEGHEGSRMAYVDAVAKSLMAGCDFSDREFRENIPAAVQAGSLTLARLDDAVARVLRVRLRLGEFDPPERLPWRGLGHEVIDSPSHHALALKAAREAVVLLQNRDHLLPLDRATLRTLAVVGPLADRVIRNNYNGRHDHLVSALTGLRRLLGPGCTVTTAPGAEISHPGPRKDGTDAPFDQAGEMATAVALAKSADVAVVCVGTDATIEQEGRDRQTLALAGNQQELIEAVLGANPRTVVVLMSAGPLAVPWIKDHVPAIVQGWWSGGEGGAALADVLLGSVDPGGRLPWTAYAGDAQVPPRDAYEISAGFTYMHVRGEPLFPFGHGLSYTSFAYGEPQLAATALGADDVLSVSIPIENTGGRAGDEVVQLYLRALAPSVPRPRIELHAFQRVGLEAGARRTVTLEVPVRKLAFWDVKTHAFVVERGAFDVLIGASSADIRARARIDITAPGSFPP